MHLDCFKVGITLSSKQQPQQQLSLIGWAFNQKISHEFTKWGVSCEGGGGGVCTHPLSFTGDGSSQAGAKVAAGTKGEIFRF